MTTEIIDSEFGTIRIRRHHNSRRLSIRLNARREVVVTVPKRTPLYAIRSTIERSRQAIRQVISDSTQTCYEDGMAIGKSHTLSIQPGETLQVKTAQNTLMITYPSTKDPLSEPVQAYIRQAVIKALRREAKHYLPRRLAQLAERFEYTYERVRFPHATSRWGSCSARGTISLNIALMQLPHELIDYVLIHELCHTKEMNHSTQFWSRVEQAEPDYKVHRKRLHDYSPII